MPQPKKPPERRQSRRKASSDAKAIDLDLLPPVAQIVPDPPAGLLKVTREAWETFWASDVARLVTPEHREALERLFTLKDSRARAYKVARETSFTKGSTGQTRLHPAWDLIRTLDAEIRNLEDRFGLTPKSRHQLGAQVADTRRSLDELNRAYQESDADEDEDPRPTAVQLPSPD